MELPRKSYEDVKKLFECRGWTLLSSEYVSAHSKLRYQCANGHVGDIRWNDFQQGIGCPECSGRKRLTLERVKQEFETNGYTVLEHDDVCADKRLNCICEKGHHIQITWNSFKRGQRCRVCAYDKQKIILSDVVDAFALSGFTVLSREYVNSRTKIRYRCSVGHESSMTWSSFKQGKRCPACDDDKKRIGIDSLRKEFLDNGFELLTTHYTNCRQKVLYKCPKGHIASSTVQSFRQCHGCFECERERRKISGPAHHNWNPGLTYKDRSDRRNFTGYGDWRKSVYIRDDYTCQVCMSRGVEINAHHLESYHANKHLRTDIDNGITLCKDCHDDFHKKYGRKYNTRAQFEEYLTEHKLRRSS